MPSNRKSVSILLEQIGKEKGMDCSFDVCESKSHTFLSSSFDPKVALTILKAIHTRRKEASIDVTLTGIPDKYVKNVADRFHSAAKSIESRFNSRQKQPSNCIIHTDSMAPNSNYVSLTCFYGFGGDTKKELEGEYERFRRSFFDELKGLKKLF